MPNAVFAGQSVGADGPMNVNVAKAEYQMNALPNESIGIREYKYLMHENISLEGRLV